MSALKWTVFINGKIERSLIFYLSLATMVSWYVLIEGEGLIIFFDSDPEHGLGIGFWAFIFFFFLFGVPTLSVTLPILIKSKIPKMLVIDTKAGKMIIHFNKKNITELNFDELTYSITEHKLHNSLTLYKTFIGTRNQPVNKKLTELIGMNFSLSWKKYQVREISKELKKQGIKTILAENRDLPLWERIISN